MTHISDTWSNPQESLSSLEPDHIHRITLVVSFLHTHLKAVEALITSLHPSGSPCSIRTDRFTWGQSFTVFEAEFEDGPSWMLRLGMCADDEYFHTATQLERKILNEVAALHLVKERTSIPVPSIVAFSAKSSPQSPLGPEAPPFVLTTAMHGTTIEDLGVAISGDGDPLQGDESKRPILLQYLSDIADIHVQLSRITFDRIGSFVLNPDGHISIGPGADYGVGPFNSAKEYFEVQAKAYQMLAEVDAMDEAEPDDQRLKRQFVAFLWKAAIMSLLDERDDKGPFPVRHGDLHSQNILVDDTGHIIGVLDWDCAGTVPWEAFAVPTFEVSGDFVDLGYRSREQRLAVHEAFNARLKAIADGPTSPSGRTLADLHDSKAGHVAGYLAYWMFYMGCDFDYTGRALHGIIGISDDIELSFKKFTHTEEAHLIFPSLDLCNSVVAASPIAIH